MSKEKTVCSAGEYTLSPSTGESGTLPDGTPRFQAVHVKFTDASYQAFERFVATKVRFFFSEIGGNSQCLMLYGLVGYGGPQLTDRTAVHIRRRSNNLHTRPVSTKNWSFFILFPLLFLENNVDLLWIDHWVKFCVLNVWRKMPKKWIEMTLYDDLEYW